MRIARETTQQIADLRTLLDGGCIRIVAGPEQCGNAARSSCVPGASCVPGNNLHAEATCPVQMDQHPEAPGHISSSAPPWQLAGPSQLALSCAEPSWSTTACFQAWGTTAIGTRVHLRRQATVVLPTHISCRQQPDMLDSRWVTAAFVPSGRAQLQLLSLLPVMVWRPRLTETAPPSRRSNPTVHTASLPPFAFLS